MKKLRYVTIRLKQVIYIFLAVVISASFVFGLDLLYMKISAVEQAKELPVIIIDAGHGGEDGGTSSSSGIVEKNINLAISKKLEALFKLSGFEIIMTRSDDRLIFDENSSTIREKKVSDIHNRMKIIEENPNSIFLSIHQNHFSQSRYNGAQVFYSKNNSESEKIADYIQQQIKSDLQPENERQIKPSGTEIYLLHNAVTPAVMVECGFLSNAGEAQNLNDDEYQTKMAFSIYNGILNYLNGKEK
ncbi:MAG: N-acetylmuramoyl-L-alanine amidase CwlD [Acutalibacteraceae bacterium]